MIGESVVQGLLGEGLDHLLAALHQTNAEGDTAEEIMSHDGHMVVT